MKTDKSHPRVMNGDCQVNGDINDDSGLSVEELVYREKFHIMTKRCKQIEADNLRLINLIYHTKKLTKKCLKEKKILVDRLEQKKDGFQSIKRPAFIEVCVLKTLFQQVVNFSSQVKKEMKPVPIVPAPILTKLLNPVVETSKHPVKKLESTPSQSPVKSTSKPSVKSRPSKSRSEKGHKKPINPYLMFCKENRVKVQDEYMNSHGREMNNTELTKELAHRWQTINPTLKQDYQSRYEVEKEKYNVIKLLNIASQPRKTASNESKSVPLTIKSEKDST